VEHLDAHAQCFRKARRADRRDHELLEIDRIVGVHPAIEDVHHRHGKQRRPGAAEIAVERLVVVAGSGLGRRQRHAEDGVGAETLLIGGTVELAEALVDAALVVGVEPGQRLPDLAIDGADGLAHALAAIALVPVAKLMRFVGPGRGARRHGGAAKGPTRQHDVHLHGGIAAAIENLPADDGGNGGHGPIPVVWQAGVTLEPS